MGLVNRHLLRVLVTFFAVLMASYELACFVYSNPVSAAQTIPYTINFQGRLADVGGVPMVNGTYNMKFRIYSAPTGGTLLWSEDRLVSGATGITVQNGLFSTQIGSVVALSPSLFTNQNLYFEVELPTPATATSASPSWTEGAMNRNKLAASAYAFNADTVDGIDGAALAQLGSANTFTSSNLISVSNANALVVSNGASNFFKVDSTGTGQVVIGTSDTSGSLFVLDTKTDAGDPAGTNGGMYYNSNAGKFRCYQAGAWTDCVSSPATLQTAYNASGTPATITTTAAKGVSIVAGAVPTADMFTITNAGQGVTAAGVNGLAVNYIGGAAGVEAAGMRVDFTPGGTTGGVWSGIRVVANATGAVSGVTEYGLKLEGPATPGVGTEKAMYVGTGWDLGVDIQSGGLQLAAQTDPAAPAAGNLRIYAHDIAGRVMPKWVGPSGVDTPIQASLGFNRVSMIIPAGGSAAASFVGGFGSTFTNSATTYANPTPAATNLLTSTRRATYASNTTAGAVVSHRQSTLQVWRGNAANMGGFFYTIRFGTSVLASGNRAFVGLSSSTAAPSNLDPLATGTSISRVGVAINANSGNWYIVTNNAGTAPTTSDLGATMPVNNSSLYELVLFSPPDGNYIGYRMRNLSTNNTVSGSLSTNLPSDTTFLAPQFWMTNNTTGAQVVMDFGGWYLESDQ